MAEARRRRSSPPTQRQPGRAPLSRTLLPASPRGAIVFAFVAAALLLGGGGSPAPFSELLVQLAAAFAAAAWLATARPQGSAAWPDGRVAAIALAVVVLPLLQLVPLPPALWQALPGREDLVATLELAGRADTWQPWSIAPASTLASLLATIPPVLVLLAVAVLGPRDRAALVALVGLFAVPTILGGTLQLAGGPASAWRMYAVGAAGGGGEITLLGFQANRNAVADVLLVSFAAIAATGLALVPRLGERAALALVAGGGVLVAMALALTGSRAGIALFLPVLVASFAMWQRERMGVSRLFAILAGGAVLAGVAALAIRGNLGLRRAFARFALERDFRFELWQDARHAIDASWPAGWGIGTVRPVMIAAERLEVVDPTLPNRVHNDYLELALEAGLPGLLALAVAASCTGWLARDAWRQADGDRRAQVIFAITALAVIGLHSIVDYPLRSMSLAVLAALAAGLLAANARQGDKEGGKPPAETGSA